MWTRSIRTFVFQGYSTSQTSGQSLRREWQNTLREKFTSIWWRWYRTGQWGMIGQPCLFLTFTLHIKELIQFCLWRYNSQLREVAALPADVQVEDVVFIDLWLITSWNFKRYLKLHTRTSGFYQLICRLRRLLELKWCSLMRRIKGEKWPDVLEWIGYPSLSKTLMQGQVEDWEHSKETQLPPPHHGASQVRVLLSS